MKRVPVGLGNHNGILSLSAFDEQRLMLGADLVEEGAEVVACFGVGHMHLDLIEKKASICTEYLKYFKWKYNF